MPRADLMPRFVAPMLATATALPTEEERWAYEIKWDGIRVIACVAGGTLELRNRSGIDITTRYPDLAGAAEIGDGHDLLLDGEVVALDEAGRPSFERLQRRMHVVDPAAQRRLATTVPVHLVVFDVLWSAGTNLMGAPYVERRDHLAALDLRTDGWMTPVASIGASAPILAFVEQHRLEGIVAKRLDSTYQPGVRSSAWVKQRSNLGQELLVCGWLDGTGTLAGGLGSLVVGYHDGANGPIRYAGRVGSGLSRADIAFLTERLSALARAASPIHEGTPPAETHWVEPQVVVEVRFSEWTGSGVLRQPVFLGVRDDRDPGTVVREDGGKAAP
ncbi:MAG TPA: non-homologous end-joining DNA ligase [Ilumatobacteraceae bacterium]